MTDEKPSYIHCEVSKDVKSLVVTAAAEHGRKRTGRPGKLTPWVVAVLTRAALDETELSSLDEWIKGRVNRDRAAKEELQ